MAASEKAKFFYGTSGTTVGSHAELEQRLDSIFANGAEGIWVHFSAAVRDSDGRKWCGDCRDADPVLRAAIAAAGLDVVGISIPRPKWKEQGENQGSEHPYRLVYGVNAIPALAWVSRERYQRRKGTGGDAATAQPKEYVLEAALFEEECNKTNLVTAFLKSGGKVEKMKHWQREAYTLPSPSL